MDDLNYFYSRHQISLMRAGQAKCVSSKASHLGMAKAYGVRVDALRAEAGALEINPL